MLLIEMVEQTKRHKECNPEDLASIAVLRPEPRELPVMSRIDHRHDRPVVYRSWHIDRVVEDEQ